MLELIRQICALAYAQLTNPNPGPIWAGAREILALTLRLGAAYLAFYILRAIHRAAQRFARNPFDDIGRHHEGGL